MFEPYTICPGTGINLAMVVSWADDPRAEKLTLTYASGACGTCGFEPYQEYYLGAERLRLLATLEGRIPARDGQPLPLTHEPGCGLLSGLDTTCTCLASLEI